VGFGKSSEIRHVLSLYSKRFGLYGLESFQGALDREAASSKLSAHEPVNLKGQDTQEHMGPDPSLSPAVDRPDLKRGFQRAEGLLDVKGNRKFPICGN